jgi:hypothetical protein
MNGRDAREAGLAWIFGDWLRLSRRRKPAAAGRRRCERAHKAYVLLLLGRQGQRPVGRWSFCRVPRPVAAFLVRVECASLCLLYYGSTPHATKGNTQTRARAPGQDLERGAGGEGEVVRVLES